MNDLETIKTKIRFWDLGLLIISEELGRGINFTFNTECKVSSVIASEETLFGLAQIQQQAGRSSRAGYLSTICVYSLSTFKGHEWNAQKTLLNSLDTRASLGDNRLEIAKALLRDFEGLPLNT